MFDERGKLYDLFYAKVDRTALNFLYSQTIYGVAFERIARFYDSKLITQLYVYNHNCLVRFRYEP